MKAILWCYNKRCRVSEDEFKTLNGFIVPTCWDEMFPAHILDGHHLCECGDGAASYETCQYIILLAFLQKGILKSPIHFDNWVVLLLFVIGSTSLTKIDTIV